MRHNISAGRLRHLVQFVSNDLTALNEYGEPDGTTQLVFEARADVKVLTGKQLEEYDTATTEQMINVLAWYNEHVGSDQMMVWEDRKYDVVNIQPSADYRSMIVTGKFVGTLAPMEIAPPPKPEGCRWIATFNGVSNYIDIEDTPVPDTFGISFYLSTNDLAKQQYVISAVASYPYFRINNTGTTRFRFATSGGSTITLSGEQLPFDTEVFIEIDVYPNYAVLKHDGVVQDTNVLTDPIDVGLILSYLCSSRGTGSFLSGTFRDFKMESNGTTLIELPVDDGFINNPVIRNLVGADATIANATEATWNEVCDDA